MRLLFLLWEYLAIKKRHPFQNDHKPFWIQSTKNINFEQSITIVIVSYSYTYTCSFVGGLLRGTKNMQIKKSDVAHDIPSTTFTLSQDSFVKRGELNNRGPCSQEQRSEPNCQIWHSLNSCTNSWNRATLMTWFPISKVHHPMAPTKRKIQVCTMLLCSASLITSWASGATDIENGDIPASYVSLPIVYNTYMFFLEFHHEFVFSPATPLGFEDSLWHWKGPHPWPFFRQKYVEEKWLKLVQFWEIGCKKLVGDFWDIQYRKQEAGQSQKAGAFQGIVLTFQRWRCAF